MRYHYPFGEELHPLVQQDRTPKKAFILGVYASAVHAKWKIENKIICQALAVASEPRIFWDGNQQEATDIIRRINIPKELGTLEPTGAHLNGPSAKTLDEHILSPLGFTRSDTWLCDLLPEARLNPSQEKVISERYNPLIKQYGLNEVTIPLRSKEFCNEQRANEISSELEESGANLLVLLGDIPIQQFLNKVTEIQYSSLQQYVDLFGYGTSTEVVINKRNLQVLPLAHPRQIGALGAHSKKWHETHLAWESKIR
ncbi:hypothetical protein [Phocaeicola oris]|uniref:hypothetical protein n=1 Tax=Phocaeicola oris TaxID=2896850 RepID=UPI00234E39F6|nr:hypothetical protein [Phocaeicola oris]MCE2615322.1 hypothetical protein [Phocaeicola oris]